MLKLNKNILSLAITSVLAGSLSACGGGVGSSSDPSVPSSQNRTTTDADYQESYSPEYYDNGVNADTKYLMDNYKAGQLVTDDTLAHKFNRGAFANIPIWSGDDNTNATANMVSGGLGRILSEDLGGDSTIGLLGSETATKNFVTTILGVGVIVENIDWDIDNSSIRTMPYKNSADESIGYGYYDYPYNRLKKLRGEGVYFSGILTGIQHSKVIASPDPTKRAFDIKIDLPNEGDPLYYFKNTMPSTNMDTASYTGKGVKVAVFEQSFDEHHPLMKDMVTNGKWVSSDTFTELSSTTEQTGEIALKRHGNAVYSAIKGKHQLNESATGVFRGGDYPNESTKLGGKVFSYGYGTAPDADVYAVEDLFNKDTPEHDIIESNVLYDFTRSLTLNQKAKTMFSGLRVVNTSSESLGGKQINEELFNAQKTLQSSWNNGKGLSYVASAGNGYATGWNCGTAKSQLTKEELTYVGCGSVSTNHFANSPFVIAVGAVDINEVHAPYSSDGAGLWVSAPGDQFLASDAQSRGGFFGGTSFAAPFVSGVLAQMYEVNPKLTWRDARHLLAKNAVKYDSAMTAKSVQTDFGKFEVQKKWVTNAAGYSFNNLYGFGGIDVPKLVQEAMNFSQTLPAFQETVYKNPTESLSLTVAEGLTPTTLTYNLTPSDGVNTVENLVLKLDGLAGDTDGVYAELVSPSGTKLTVIGYAELNNNFSTSTQTHIANINGFYGEPVTGTWTLNLYDLNRSASPDLVISQAQLKVYGH